MRALVFLPLLFVAACQNSVPPGVEPMTLYVIDAVSGASLCTADATLNGAPMAAGGGQSVGCYFVPATTLAPGTAFTLVVSDDGYAPQTQMGTIPSDGLTVVVQLVPLDDGGAPDASTDASTDASSADSSTSDASTDAPAD